MEEMSESGTEYIPISATTLAASVLSLIGSSTILLSYLLYSRGTGIANMILFLAIADMGWSITEIFAFTIILHDPESYSLTICKVARGVFQFFSSAAVMWSMCICVFLYRSVLTREPNSDKLIMGTKQPRFKSMILYHLIGWGVPTAQCLIIFAPDHADIIYKITNQRICIPREPYLGFAWFFPIGFAIGVSAALYSVFINRIFRLTRTTGAAASQQLPLRLASYVLVLFICWVPNLVAYLALLDDHHTRSNTKTILMAVVNGLLELQGALDCLIYGFTNREFRNNFSAKYFLFQVILAPILLPFALCAAIAKKCRSKKGDYSPLLDKKQTPTRGVLQNSTSGYVLVGTPGT